MFYILKETKKGKWEYKRGLISYQNWQGQKKLARQFYNTILFSNMKNVITKKDKQQMKHIWKRELEDISESSTKGQRWKLGKVMRIGIYGDKIQYTPVT